jgi:hypothetical protein
MTDKSPLDSLLILKDGKEFPVEVLATAALIGDRFRAGEIEYSVTLGGCHAILFGMHEDSFDRVSDVVEDLRVREITIEVFLRSGELFINLMVLVAGDTRCTVWTLDACEPNLADLVYDKCVWAVRTIDRAWIAENLDDIGGIF